MKTGLFLLLALPNLLFAQLYAVEKIPEKLSASVNYVIREDHVDLTIESIGKGIQKEKYVVTLLNEKASDAAMVYRGYDKLRTIKSINVTIYDKNGRKVDSFKKKDFNDVSQFESFTLYSDNRAIYKDFAKYKYPFTIEVEAETLLDGLMFLPSQYFQSGKASVEHASFKVTTPLGYEVNYKSFFVGEPQVNVSNNTRQLYWQMRDQLPVETEPWGKSFDQLVAKVMLAPNVFEIEGYRGSMNSWQELGRFQYELFRDLEDISESLKAQINQMVSGAESDTEKIKILYKYLQDNYRYVSVQLGIGGWKPFSPSYVENYQYGDCKALTYFMKSILKSVGIESYYTLINAGSRREIYEDFARPRFNHVILSVPIKSDTIWLECTSQISPFNYLGSFTSDRQALMISESDAKVIRTPKFRHNQNLRVSNTILNLEESGNANIKIDINYTGERIEDNGSYFRLNQGADEKKEWAKRILDVADYQLLTDIESNIDNYTPHLNASFELKAKSFASVTGKRLIIGTKVLKEQNSTFKPNEDRKSDVIIEDGIQNTDTLRIVLPENYYPEYLIPESNLEYEFGSYSVKVLNIDQKLFIIRNFELRSGTYNKQAFDDLVKFYREIEKLDGQKLVLKNVT